MALKKKKAVAKKKKVAPKKAIQKQKKVSGSKRADGFVEALKPGYRVAGKERNATDKELASVKKSGMSLKGAGIYKEVRSNRSDVKPKAKKGNKL